MHGRRGAGRGGGPRRIWGGRRKIRETLYIAALTATRGILSLVALSQRMRAAGRSPKTMLIAAGRQLLVILNAMIRTRQPIRL
jgi:transposase